MAKIKKLKENGATIYPATIPQAVVDPVDNTTLSEIIEAMALTFGDMNETKNILQAMSDLRSTVNEHSNSGLKGYAQYINLFIEKVNSFLEDADASDTTINRWKEIESFLAGITDKETLTGLLSENLMSAKSYTDSKVSSATANAVTMGSNAGAADRVMVSAGANKTAKDSGVALSSLARTTTATSSANGLMSSADKAKLDGIATNANKYVLPTATSSVLGGIKSGGNITVGSDGTVTVNKATATDMAGHATEADRATYADSAGSATKATQDSTGANITTTYLKASAVTDVTDYKEITL